MQGFVFVSRFHSHNFGKKKFLCRDKQCICELGNCVSTNSKWKKYSVFGAERIKGMECLSNRHRYNGIYNNICSVEILLGYKHMFPTEGY